MQRRHFIKSSCTACLGVLGAGSLLSLLNGCAPLPLVKSDAQNGVIDVPVSAFVAEQTMTLVRSQKMDYDILLIKKKDGTYNALYMQCTHENQPLNASKSGLYCSAHGSAFDLEGNVTQQPANRPLRKFKTEADQQTIHIHLT